MSKIKTISNDGIIFDNGFELFSEHEQDCCEKHYLDFNYIKEDDYKKLNFDLSNDNFFTKIEGYGIQLNTTNNFPLRIPGYAYNNGYYSTNLSLILKTDKGKRTYNIEECQIDKYNRE